MLSSSIIDSDVPMSSKTALGFRLGRQVTNTILPPIPKAKQWAQSYTPSNRRPLLDVSQGAPGIPPPQSLLNALSVAAGSPASCGYTHVAGEVSLRKALADEMRHIYGDDTDVSLHDIVLTAGCNMAFMATVMSLADAGDEIIIPVPWYFNHHMALSMLGIITVPLVTNADTHFRPSPELAASLITSKTKAIALVTPNNPTGAVYSPSLIAAFAHVARENNIALIVDETYRDFIISGPPHHLFSPTVFEQGWRSNFVHLYSFSKSYCIPGHRLGAIVASPEVILPIMTILDTMQICPPRAVQIALASLLPTFRSFISDQAKSIERRHELFRNLLPPRWKIGSQGGFFAYVKHPFKGVYATEVSRRLAEEIGVVTLPAEFFCQAKVAHGSVTPGDDDMWIRFSVANVDDEEIRKVCERLAECEERLEFEI